MILEMIAVVVFCMFCVFFCAYMILADTNAGKHYRVSITTRPDGLIGVYQSKLTARGKDAITVVPAEDEPLVDVIVHLDATSATVVDMRNGGLERAWK